MMKTPEPTDPMELVGVALPAGDSDYMAECVVEEYMLLGFNEKQLMSIFRQPLFQATHRIYDEKGEEYVRALIERVRDKWSQSRVRGGASDA